MTVVETPNTMLCPTSSEAMADLALITVTDREVELTLMDGDYNSCLRVYGKGQHSLHFVAYIYTPPHTRVLQVTVLVFGVDCMDSALSVYDERHIMEDDDKPFNQCSMAGSESLTDSIRRCEFICQVTHLHVPVVKVHIQVERCPWLVGRTVKLCDIDMNRGMLIP